MAERESWFVEIEDHKSPHDWYAAAIWEKQSDGSLQIVARVPQSDNGWDAAVRARDEANARLMSAGPDLHDVVSRLYAVVVGHSGEVEDCDLCQLQGLAQAALEKVRTGRGAE